MSRSVAELFFRPVCAACSAPLVARRGAFCSDSCARTNHLYG
ncbi:hypothetical protein [Rathayibacter sp. AY1E6]|nr:hypothetical protein [Rathayibacter sp. AY1E6]